MKKILLLLVLLATLSFATPAKTNSIFTDATVYGQIFAVTNQYGTPTNQEIRSCTVVVTDGTTVVGTSLINPFLYYTVTVPNPSVNYIYHWDLRCGKGPEGYYLANSTSNRDFTLLGGYNLQVNGNVYYYPL